MPKSQAQKLLEKHLEGTPYEVVKLDGRIATIEDNPTGLKVEYPLGARMPHDLIFALNSWFIGLRKPGGDWK